MPTKTNQLPDRTLRVLIGSLNLLSSDKLGEVQAAALAAHRLVKSAGMTWEDFLQPPAVKPKSDPPQPKPKRPRRETPPPEPPKPSWRFMALFCLEEYASQLTTWETEFLRSLIARQRDLTDKQAAVLQRCFQKCGGKL